MPLEHLITHVSMETAADHAGKILPLIMENESEGFVVRLIITNIHDKYEENSQKPAVNYLDAKLLVKLK